MRQGGELGNYWGGNEGSMEGNRAERWVGPLKDGLIPPTYGYKVAYTATTKSFLWPFILDYPGEPIPEETFTHLPLS